ncbi:hypothetical protein [Sphaerotilus uruguayifluvii]|uniref:PEGA domain-containing protein n=1 Tax=Sphaerotilus uruguayifluvii TaxID=2735897 RepID=A0ABX2G8S7_9BURK|nr:hypothetical protein [Leptothrix sp. C29]NRT58146.1 hypothetical protein [Leptothrix sp. C29]
MISSPLRTLSAIALALSLSACATIMGQPTQLVPIASTPSDASISITDEGGTEIFRGRTPTSVTLPKSTGRYWGGKSFKVVITKDGYQTQTIPVTSAPNGWYLAGNFLFGGLIGWFVVDPLSGSMYTLSPDAISAQMSASTAQSHNNRATDGSISIVLLQDVPAALRDKMVRVN